MRRRMRCSGLRPAPARRAMRIWPSTPFRAVRCCGRYAQGWEIASTGFRKFVLGLGCDGWFWGSAVPRAQNRRTPEPQNRPMTTGSAFLESYTRSIQMFDYFEFQLRPRVLYKNGLVDEIGQEIE